MLKYILDLWRYHYTVHEGYTNIDHQKGKNLGFI